MEIYGNGPIIWSIDKNIPIQFFLALVAVETTGGPLVRFWPNSIEMYKLGLVSKNWRVGSMQKLEKNSIYIYTHTQ